MKPLLWLLIGALLGVLLMYLAGLAYDYTCLGSIRGLPVPTNPEGMDIGAIALGILHG